MNRRGFIKGLLSLGAVTAAGVAIVEPEPVRRFWQVGRGAPVGERHSLDALLREHYGEIINPLDANERIGVTITDTEDGLWRVGSVNIKTGNELARTTAGRMAIAEEFTKHGLLTPDELVKVFTDTAPRQVHFSRPSIGYDDAWDLSDYQRKLDRLTEDAAHSLRMFGEARVIVDVDEPVGVKG